MLKIRQKAHGINHEQVSERDYDVIIRCIASQPKPEELASETGEDNFSYRELSQLSEATDDVYAESVHEAAGADLKDYNRLVQNTQKKMTILSQTSEKTKAAQAESDEKSDEFLRNFFIKFGMRKTLESFQQEWYELKAKNELDTS